jgi:membrane protease YdiL (CAAX protease family)
VTEAAGPRPAVHWGVPLAVLAGVLALAARRPAPVAVLVAAGVGAVGALAPLGLPDRLRRAHLPWSAVTFLGAAPFVVFTLWARPLPARGGWLVAATGVVAAVAEELFFRRLVYGWLSRRGPAVAVAGSALLFALVHLPAYGAAVLPIDLAAGLVFGWQRYASGGWTAPAATHALANLLALA